MVQQTSPSGKSRRNARISLSKRKKLIFFVKEKSYSIGKAASRLKIKLSTAKMIVKRYTTHGTFFQPKPHHAGRNLPSKRQEQDGEEVAVKMEDREAEVKMEEADVSCHQEEERARTDVSSRGAGELPTLRSLPPWKMSLGEFGYFFDGYAFLPYGPPLQPFFLC